MFINYFTGARVAASEGTTKQHLHKAPCFHGAVLDGGQLQQGMVIAHMSQIIVILLSQLKHGSSK